MSKAALRDLPANGGDSASFPQEDEKQSATDQRDVPPAAEITGRLLAGKPLSTLKMNMISLTFQSANRC